MEVVYKYSVCISQRIWSVSIIKVGRWLIYVEIISVFVSRYGTRKYVLWGKN